MTPKTPRLIVEVRGGRSNAEKAIIEQGQSLRVGRTTLADLVVPHDDQLSSVHFEITWDGQRCSLRDKNSIKGTFLSGMPVLKAEIPHGAWIRAGRTDFMVYVEGWSARIATNSDDDADEADDDEAPDPDFAIRLAAAEKALTDLRAEAQKAPLYAILDTARDDRILQILRESIEKHQSLYEGTEGEALDHVAPYLVGPMRADSALLGRLVLEGWGERWGIYLTSQAPFKEVRRHFRRLLMVELEETGEKVYFRFYDPSSLATVLPRCGPGQVKELVPEASCLLHESALRAVALVQHPPRARAEAMP